MKLLKCYLKLICIFLIVFNSSCSDYQKILKSNDLEYKYQEAVNYFNENDFIKAYPLFQELLLLFRGTAKFEDVYYFYAKTLFEKGNYLASANEFKKFHQTFKDSPRAEESLYKSIYSYFLLCPVYSLDQTNTYKTLDEIGLFLELYPNSLFIDKISELKLELLNKLEKKAFENSKQYYRTENYKSAIYAFNNFLKENQNSQFKEEVLFLQLCSYYELAINSIEEKIDKRIKDCLISYNQFKNEYPTSKFKNESKKMYNNLKNVK